MTRPGPIWLGVDTGARYLGVGVVQLLGQSKRVLYVEGFDLYAMCFSERIDPTIRNVCVASTKIVRDVVDRFEPDGAAIEAVLNTATGKGEKRFQSGASLQNIKVQGEVAQLLRGRDYSVQEVEPLTWKRKFGVCGKNGKPMPDKKTRDSLARQLGLDFGKWPVKPWIHGVEALAIAVTGEAMFRVNRRTG